MTLKRAGGIRFYISLDRKPSLILALSGFFVSHGVGLSLEGCYSSEHSLQQPLMVVTQMMRSEPVF